ncbi:xylose isomerase-like protein [Sphaerulina musiva SO2202]|uniref:Xylose isomerase-like protein n=1 Tax=Sphaerulina musiva (strain SO2202) TaxID=692275 RepID=M3AWU1_SPHMS|nr:xylose isomerase-like protein [Sphaerulina musiva SO2202]EMF11185.1 xylose isomerase-like protein [Sphaerulina musiva SO2202]
MPCKPAISSHSLGRAWSHSLPTKLDAAASHSLSLELFHEDLVYLAATFPGGPTPSNQLLAAQTIRSLCSARNISIISLQPFMHYEGLRDRELHEARIREMRDLWIPLARALGTRVIAVPSSFLGEEECGGDEGVIVRDLRELADLGVAAASSSSDDDDGKGEGEGDIIFAYEALCWGTHISTWEQSWEIVQKVSRSNFQICFDTFNLAGKVFADPMRPGGIKKNAEEAMEATLRRILERVDVRRIAYIQVVDAERLSTPLIKGHEFYHEDQPARMSWSRNCRLFYGEEDRGAYLPVYAILKTLLVDLGFEGYVSAEVFHRDLGKDDRSVPEEFAQRAKRSWEKIVEDFGLERGGEEKVAVVEEGAAGRSAGGVVDRFPAVEGAAARAQL